MSSNTPTPDRMQTDSPQGEHRQARLDTFKQSVRIALDEPLKESWDTAEGSFIEWSFQMWELAPHELQEGLINMIAKGLRPVRPPISVQTAVPRDPNHPQQGSAPQLAPSSNQRPYRKPSQLRQIPDYDGTLSGDAADRWLREVDQFFWLERNLAGTVADEFQMVALCKNKLVRGAGDRLLSQLERVDSGFEAPIETMDQFKRWIRENFQEYLSRDRLWDQFESAKQGQRRFQEFANEVKLIAIRLGPNTISPESLKRKFFQGAKPALKKRWPKEGLAETAHMDDCVRRWVEIERGETVSGYYNNSGSGGETMVDDPMDLSAVANSNQRPKKTNPAWEAWCRQHDACFSCGRTGHGTRQCSSKPKRGKAKGNNQGNAGGQ